jgi:hypothetical protein
MDILNKKNLIIGILGLIIIIVEIGMIVNAYLTVKYKVEMSEDMSKLLNIVYSIIGTLSTIIVFDLVILIILLFFYLKNS